MEIEPDQNAPFPEMRFYEMDRWLGYPVADDDGIVRLKSVYKPARNRVISKRQWETLPLAGAL